MKIRIKSFNGELPSYLTVGKVYEVDKEMGSGFWIVADNSECEYVLLDDCAFLNGGSWEIVGDNITDNVADIKYHVSPLTKVSCHHQWVNADSIGGTEHQYFCAYCGEKRTEAFGVKREV